MYGKLKREMLTTLTTAQRCECDRAIATHTHDAHGRLRRKPLCRTCHEDDVRRESRLPEVQGIASY